MKRVTGKSVYKGVAIGKVLVFSKADDLVKRTKIEDVNAELARFEKAKETARGSLQKLYEKAVVEVGEASAAIFEVHQMMWIPFRRSSAVKRSMLNMQLP